MSNRTTLLSATLQVVAGLYLGNIRGESGNPACQRGGLILRWLQNGFGPSQERSNQWGWPPLCHWVWVYLRPTSHGVGWGWGIRECLLELVLLADSEDRDSLRRHGVTHILSVHNRAKPVLEVSAGQQAMLRWHPVLGGGLAGRECGGHKASREGLKRWRLRVPDPRCCPG